MQTVFIIGAGAIGRVLAVSLAQAEFPVVLLRGHTPQPQAQQEWIRVELPGNGVLQASILVSPLSSYPVLDGIVVLTNKSFGNTSLAQMLQTRTRHSPVVLLQNGLGVEQPFLNLDFPEIYRCVLFATSQFTEAGHLRFKPVAVSPIGLVRGTAHALETVATRLHTPVFPFRAEASIQPIIWKKAIANSVFNSICPLLETDNGIFQRNAVVMALARKVIEECVAIARLEGVRLTAEEVEESVLLISRMSDGQFISTLQDIRQRRPTEIDTLNAAMAAIARQHGQESLVTTTQLLGELTKLKSDLNR